MKSRSPFREFYILKLRESQEQICSVYKIASTSCAHECDLILLINACTQNLSIFAPHPIYLLSSVGVLKIQPFFTFVTY